MKTVLVVANETLGGKPLIDAIRARAAKGDVRFVLCVPQSRPRAGLVVYDDAVSDAAQARVDLALGFIRSEDIEAIGEVGDPDPYAATMDAVYEYRPDEIIISTYPATRSGWLRRDLIERVTEASGLPVEHVVADIDNDGLEFKVTLVIANRTAGGDELLEALKAKADTKDHGETGRLYLVVIPQEGGDGPATRARAHFGDRTPSRCRPVRHRHDRRPGSVHRNDERAAVLPSRRDRYLDLRRDEVGLAAG